MCLGCSAEVVEAEAFEEHGASWVIDWREQDRAMVRPQVKACRAAGS
jgi:hypothetical protein